MKIAPKMQKLKGSARPCPVGATITINERDAVELATILSYAVRSESCGRMLYQLAAACEGITTDADVTLRYASGGGDKKHDAAYDKVRKLFDPEYGGGGE